MNSKQMRWISYIILAAMLLPLLTACSGSAEEVSTATEVSSSSAQSASATQSMSASSSASQSKSVTYSNATIEDVQPLFVLDENGNLTEYMYEKQMEEYIAELHLPEPDYLQMVNNEIPLQELLKKNPRKVSAENTWSLSSGLVNSVWYKDIDAYENNYSVNWIAKVIGFDITFTRTVGEFYDEQRNEQAMRMYTVFESEMGGYIYCFFNYYIKSQFTILRNTLYQPKSVSKDEVCNIKGGDSIWDLSQIEPFTLYIKSEIKSQIPGLYQRFMFLTNQTTYAISFDTEGNVVSAGTLENNVAMNPWPAEYYTAEENIVGDDTSPWNIYDFTILPQDYPPA